MCGRRAFAEAADDGAAPKRSDWSQKSEVGDWDDSDGVHPECVKDGTAIGFNPTMAHPIYSRLFLTALCTLGFLTACGRQPIGLPGTGGRGDGGSGEGGQGGYDPGGYSGSGEGGHVGYGGDGGYGGYGGRSFGGTGGTAYQFGCQYSGCPGYAFCEDLPGSCSLDLPLLLDFAGPAGGAVAAPRGVCVARPRGCDDNYAPVCGCDGQTYSNDCQRRQSGVSKVHDGECPPREYPLSQGIWGGEHIELNAQSPNNGGSIRFDCGSATIDAPLMVQEGGDFAWSGTDIPGTGGGQGIGRPQPARFFGSVNGIGMRMVVEVSNRTVAELYLTYRQMPTLFLCL